MLPVNNPVVPVFMKPWEIISRREVFDASPFLTLHRETLRLENGDIVDDYYTIDQQDFVVIFAVVNLGEILGIRHYKHGVKRINLGLPAGYIENGEEPLFAAKRELMEETGYAANIWKQLGSFVVDGYRGCGHIHVFFAADIAKERDPNPDDLETILLEKIPLNQLPKVLANGEVSTLGAAIGISLGLLELNISGKM
jgi:ADP-ribose pyrophosphatase